MVYDHTRNQPGEQVRFRSLIDSGRNVYSNQEIFDIIQPELAYTGAIVGRW